jgi:hypothetical protein
VATSSAAAAARSAPGAKGLKRIQHTGSRTVHRLAFKIRHGQQVAARYRQEDKP